MRNRNPNSRAPHAFRTRKFSYWITFCLALFSAARSGYGEEPTYIDIDRPGLELLVTLASDTPDDPEPQQAAMNQLYEEIDRAAREHFISVNVLAGAPDEQYTDLPMPEGDEPADYLWAIRVSHARFLGAQRTGDAEWMGRQMAAGRQHAAAAAKLFAAQAAKDEAQARRLRQFPFAIRRSPEQAQAYFETLRSHGVTPQQLKLLQESGHTEAQMKKYLPDLLALPADQVGMSLEEGYRWIGDFRGDLAGLLEEFSRGDVRHYYGRMQNSFLVGNPTDKEATVDLYIRRVAISPQWELSVISAPASQPEAEVPPAPVQEVKAGEHYRVRLQAGESTRVGSVLVPVGPVGQNTTARWAVEGKIGDELIGGMMHEMHVPAVAAELEPPQGVAGIVPAAARAEDSRWMSWTAAAMLLMLILAAVLVVRRRRAHD